MDRAFADRAAGFDPADRAGTVALFVGRSGLAVAGSVDECRILQLPAAVLAAVGRAGHAAAGRKAVVCPAAVDEYGYLDLSLDGGSAAGWRLFCVLALKMICPFLPWPVWL